jgi:DNA gyrase/topoisomerase IV subunit A
MGLNAAGVSGIKLEDKDIVVGAEVMPAQGEILLVSSDGKAKRVEQKEFPKQGRYGKGVTAWDLPKKVTIAGVALAKSSAHVTIHLAKAAAKSHRLDEAPLRKRAATRGDALVELKPGDEVTGVASAWSVDRFLKLKEEAPKKKAAKAKAKKVAPGKKKTTGRKIAAKKKPVRKTKPAARKKK